jgi:hypothetical protein
MLEECQEKRVLSIGLHKGTQYLGCGAFAQKFQHSWLWTGVAPVKHSQKSCDCLGTSPLSCTEA